MNGLDDFHNNRITRILTTDFPQYFAILTRIRQEVHAIGPEGGILSSTVVPQVQAIFPEGALTKKIKVGLQVGNNNNDDNDNDNENVKARKKFVKKRSFWNNWFGCNCRKSNKQIIHNNSNNNDVRDEKLNLNQNENER